MNNLTQSNSLNEQVNRNTDQLIESKEGGSLEKETFPFSPDFNKSEDWDTQVLQKKAQDAISRNSERALQLQSDVSSTDPDLQVQAKFIDPARQYGTFLSSTEAQFESIGIHAGDLLQGARERIGLRQPWSDQQKEVRRAKLAYYEDLATHTPIFQRVLADSLAFAPSLVTDALPAEAVAMIGGRLISMGGNALRMGRVADISEGANLLSFKPIAYGLNGVMAGLGWTGADQLDAKAIDANFDKSEYLLNSLSFGGLGAGIGGAIHFGLGKVLLENAERSYQAIRKGINPVSTAIFSKFGIDKIKDSIGDEVITGKKDSNSQVNGKGAQNNFSNLSETLKENLSEHNNARASLGLKPTETPTTSINIAKDKTLTAVTNDDIAKKLAIPSLTYKDIKFDNAIDAAIYRWSKTDSSSIKEKLEKNLIDLLNVSQKKLTQQANFLDSIAKNTPKGEISGTISSSFVDHILPTIDSKYEKSMLMRGETPYTPAKKTVETEFNDLSNKSQSLKDKMMSDSLSQSENSFLTTVGDRLEQMGHAVDRLPFQETEALKGLDKNMNEAVDKLNTTAIRHFLLSKQQDLADEALNGLTPRQRDFTPQQIRDLLGLPTDASRKLRLEGYSEEGADQGELEQEMLDQYKNIPPNTVKSKYLNEELKSIEDNEKDMNNYKPWLEKLTQCLTGNEI